MKKGEHVENTKSLLDPEFCFLFMHNLPFSPGHLLESKGRFVNLFGDFSPLCGGAVRCDVRLATAAAAV